MPIVEQLFVAETEKFLARRRPHFRETIEELPVLRGRANLNALISRQARGRTAIECEFDELDHDAPWQRLILAAARLTSTSASQRNLMNVATRSRQIERKMSDVTVVHPRLALKEWCPQVVSRQNRLARAPVFLAKSLILQRYPFGTEDEMVSQKPATAAAVRVSTPELFERLIARLDPHADYKLKHRFRRVAIFKNHGGSSKQPDFHLVDSVGTPVAIVDAKYKLRPTGIASMSMSDQYQGYAYSAATGLPMVFICYHEGGKSIEPDLALTIVEDAESCAIALASIRFPEAETFDSWTVSAEDLIAKCLNRVLNGLGQE
jgi:hypothetical protein